MDRGLSPKGSMTRTLGSQSHGPVKWRVKQVTRGLSPRLLLVLLLLLLMRSLLLLLLAMALWARLQVAGATVMTTFRLRK